MTTVENPNLFAGPLVNGSPERTMNTTLDAVMPQRPSTVGGRKKTKGKKKSKMPRESSRSATPNQNNQSMMNSSRLTGSNRAN